MIVRGAAKEGCFTCRVGSTMRSIVVQLSSVRVCISATSVKSKDEPSSIQPERHVLEAIDLRRVIFHLTVMLVVVVVMMMRVLIFGFGHAAVAVGRWHETVEAVADDALAPLARDVGDVRDSGAVLALGRVSGEGNHASTTYDRKTSHSGTHERRQKKKLTAFEIACSVDALPCARVVAVHTACQPAVSPLSAGTTAEPAPSVAARLLRGTCAVGYALAVADLQGLLAYALGGVVLREGRESVNALECTFIRAADRLGVVRVMAVIPGG